MARTVSIGAQHFADIRDNDYFLVDKTDFIRQWWGEGDQVTLICRPRRFGKTLSMSMLECFFSQAYAGRDDLFDGLTVWNDPAMRREQGKWPVISLSFSGVKAPTFQQAVFQLRYLIAQAYRSQAQFVDTSSLSDAERDLFAGRALAVSEEMLPFSLQRLCELVQSDGRRVIVLLDEYDTPMQEAWVSGYWGDMVALVRSIFNNTFKTNPYLERAVLTGITRVSRESVFSDLNNLEVVTTTSQKYASCFGFTEAEVFASMDEMGLDDRNGVKRWYDGFFFGGVTDIYNPWSITKYLDTGRLGPYWVNTSSNSLASKVIREGDAGIKVDFEELMRGGTTSQKIDEQVVFGELGSRPGAVWSLLLANGYLRVVSSEHAEDGGRMRLALTNLEVREAFDSLVRGWFEPVSTQYNGFVRSLLDDDVESMNRYMNDVALVTFSSFDVGISPSSAAPERFYHGFVLGLLVELRDTYRVRSNRESGYGRYDIMLEPLRPGLDGMVIEFKVLDSLAGEATLADTVAAAHAQIEDRRYADELRISGTCKSVRCYGFAFQGKHVLIG